MSISSINTNQAALLAQQNISNANTATANEVSALSSGNRIVQASTDVAALSVGTSLQSQVNILNTSLSVASQGSSLLQVADGALAQIQAILQQQQSVATQAQAGSLSSTQLGFLNEEFQQLTTQIDQLAGSTNFNGVDLLNGGIQGGTSINTNTTNGSTTTPPAATIGTIATNAGIVADNTFTITVGGQPAATFTFGTGSNDVAIGSTGADTAANLAAALNNSGLSQLADFRFSSDSSGDIKAYYTGSAAAIGNIPSVVTSTNNTTDLTNASLAVFSTATAIATVTGTINAGDTLTIGSHVITFAANGTNTTANVAVSGDPAYTATGGNISVDIGTGGTTTSAALTNVETALNALSTTNANFSDLSAITFSTTGGDALVATYSGNSPTPPTISTSYVSHAPVTLTGASAAPVNQAPTLLFTANSNTFTSGASVVTVGAATITVGAAAGGSGLTQTVQYSGTLSTTLGEIVTALNSSSVNADLGAGYAGAVYSTNGTSIFLNNATNISGSVSGSVANGTPTGATTSGVQIAQNAPTAIITTVATAITTATTYTIDGTVDISFVDSGASGAAIQLGADNTITLQNLANYLNSTAGQAALAGGTDNAQGVAWTVSGSGEAGVLNAANPTATATINLPTVVAANAPGDETLAATPALAHQSEYGLLATTTGGTGVLTIGNGTTLTIGSASHLDTITFVAGAPTGADQVELGANDAATLEAAAAYLNSSAGQTQLSGNSNPYAGLVFTTDGTNNLYVANSGSAITPSPTGQVWGASAPVGTVIPSAATNAASAVVGTFTGTIAVGDQITVGGHTYSVVGSGATPVGNQINLGASSGNGVTANTLANLVTFLNTGSYNGTSFAPVIANTVFSSNASGQLLAQNDQDTLTGTLTSSYTSVANPTFVGVVGQDLADISAIGLGAGVTSAVGTPSGSLFVSDTGNPSTTDYGQAVDLSGVANNADFLGAFGGTGTIGAITANYVDTNNPSTSGVQFSVVVGNDTYTTSTIENSVLNSSTATTPVALTFTGSNTVTTAAEGGSFTLTLQPQSGNITSQNSASQLATGINAALSTVSASQNRNVLSYNNNYSATVGGNETATLAGSSLSFNSTSFANPLISQVTVTAPSTGQTDATITAVVNGQTFSTTSGIGDKFGTDSDIVLENLSDPTQTLTLTTGGTQATGDSSGIAIDLSSASNAAAFQTALSNALGLNNANAGLTFQVGSSSTDVLGVSISSATTSTLFGGQSIDVSSQTDAATAATVVANALNTISSLRANVGALESRFTYASNAITSAVQNEGAAQSALLDTDVAAESTDFATSQVQLQAGIAVLAQANQLQQNLLKLIS